MPVLRASAVRAVSSPGSRRLDSRVQDSRCESPRGGAMSGPASTHDLRPSERAFVTAMRQLLFGRFEFLRIERGELALQLPGTEPSTPPAVPGGPKLGRGHPRGEKSQPGSRSLAWRNAWACSRNRPWACPSRPHLPGRGREMPPESVTEACSPFRGRSTRDYNIEDARSFLSGQGVDVEARSLLRSTTCF
jgi:hypothetical protein